MDSLLANHNWSSLGTNLVRKPFCQFACGDDPTCDACHIDLVFDDGTIMRVNPWVASGNWTLKVITDGVECRFVFEPKDEKKYKFEAGIENLCAGLGDTLSDSIIHIWEKYDELVSQPITIEEEEEEEGEEEELPRKPLTKRSRSLDSGFAKVPLSKRKKFADE